MSSALRAFAVFASIIVGYCTLIGCVALLGRIGLGLGIFALMYLLFCGGWMYYAFLRYRQGRQAELRQLLTAIVESNGPLSPALRAYAADRPDDSVRTVWLVVLLNVLFPGYYWLWYTRRTFDRRVETLADDVEMGVSFSEALAAVPALADAETRLAVEVGEATGQLAVLLQRANRERESAAWIELIPTLAYPLFVLQVVSSILTFQTLIIFPKYLRIFQEFGMTPLPESTRIVMALGEWVNVCSPFIGLGVMLVLAVFSIVVTDSTVRWYTPFVGHIYGWELQGRLLRMLGALTAAGRPLPEALELLAQSGEFPPVVQHRLIATVIDIEHGHAFAPSMASHGLLPNGMVAVVETAQRARTLSWTLPELGNYLSGRGLRFVRKLVQVVSPVLVMVMGLIVGLVVVGTFLPLVQLIESMGEL